LPFIDFNSILEQPKILMGYSDTTTLTSSLNLRGMVTFNGPSVMAGFAQMRHLPSEFAAHVKAILMEPQATYAYEPYPMWTDRYREWATQGYDGEVKELQPHDGWSRLQGEGVHQGTLFGGCIEVFEFLKATPWWPPLDFWNGKILFFETSEEKPTVDQVEYMLRNYGSMGALERIAGLVVGRARSYTPEEKEKLYAMLPRIVGFEFGRTDMPILANFDFGHTDPQFVMPLGIHAEIDCNLQTFRLLEPAVL
jgi:muramoyltetrapeptide carboxypeptidase LdcA involved in peptidoglycan recycling